MSKFRDDIKPIVDINTIKKEEWKNYCPSYGEGYKHLSGLYCDYCMYLYDDNRKLCPNNK